MCSPCNRPKLSWFFFSSLLLQRERGVVPRLRALQELQTVLRKTQTHSDQTHLKNSQWIQKIFRRCCHSWRRAAATNTWTTNTTGSCHHLVLKPIHHTWDCNIMLWDCNKYLNSKHKRQLSSPCPKAHSPYMGLSFVPVESAKTLSTVRIQIPDLSSIPTA